MEPVLVQVQAAFNQLAEAAVRARRAAADAEQARDIYERTAQGATDPKVRRAMAEAQIAADKCGRYANLLDAARAQYEAYFKVVAPGWRFSIADGMPDGERLAEEALAQESRAEQLHRKLVNGVGEKEGEIKQGEQLARDIASAIKDLVKPGDTHSGTVAPGQNPFLQPRVQDSQHPVADVVIALTGAGLIVHSFIRKLRNSKAKKNDRDQAGDS
ncbi:hypothetical protein O7543_23070 [Solwaraspora sp. WMMA2080]|uniref:hypothetical protein n=1 Tax=Solwaraspora sp. WMMA2080 TaxID=3015165 RepID=UPI00248AD154|nr:hypothetical protein [Solwaraspora sp. WMMA2080]WBC19692.1 hypothetical protein O7543_23070 [Solwaraspora sp. WMMA2080]